MFLVCFYGLVLPDLINHRSWKGFVMFEHSRFHTHWAAAAWLYGVYEHKHNERSYPVVDAVQKS